MNKKRLLAVLLVVVMLLGLFNTTGFAVDNGGTDDIPPIDRSSDVTDDGSSGDGIGGDKDAGTGDDPADKPKSEPDGGIGVAGAQSQTISLDIYTLTIDKRGDGNGTVTKNPDKAKYGWGTVVALAATPNADSSFRGFYQSRNGNNYYNKLASNQVTMYSSKTIYAVFDKLPTFSVKNTASDDNGKAKITYNGETKSIGKNSIATFIYVEGLNQVDINFNANTGFRFERDTNVSGPPSYENPTNRSISPNQTTNVHPTWIEQYTITTTVTNGTINPVNPKVDKNGSVTITYQSNNGYELDYVMVNNINKTSSNPTSYTFSDVTSNQTIDVAYKIKNYGVEFFEEDGTTQIGQTQRIDHGLSATAPDDPKKQGHEFKGWSNGTETLSGAQINALPVIAPASYIAVFDINQYTVTFDGGDHGDLSGTTEYTLDYNSLFPTAPTVTENDGYTFSGWFPVLPEKVTESETYVAQYNAIDYKVKYDRNGASSGFVPVDTRVYHVDDAVTVKGNPGWLTRLGYTFAGWEYGGNVYQAGQAFDMPASDVTLKAKWEPITYTVRYFANDGTPRSVTSSHSYGEWSELRKNTFSVAGYSFEGWAIFPLGNKAYNDEQQVRNLTFINGGEVWLYAKWSLNTYTVTFDSNGGTPISPQDVKYCKLVTKPADPEKPGYIFEGWFKDEQLTTKWRFSKDKMPAGDIALYAKWTPEDYHINYILNGGINNPNNPESYNIESNKIWLRTPTKTGYLFLGWYEPGKKLPTLSISAGSTGEKTFTAKWVVIPYPIGYKYNGGDASNPYIYTVESVITLNNPTKTGYTFAGWSGTGIEQETYPMTVELVGATGPRCYTAHWTVNNYTITYHANGGTGTMAPSELTYDVSQTLSPNTFAREGYTFVGWAIESTGAKVYDDKHEVYNLASENGDNVNLYAIWSVNSYNVTYESNGGNAVAAATVAYDTLVTEPTAPTKQYHSFKGWFKDAALTQAWNFASDKIGAADMTLYAKWEANAITNLNAKETMYVGGRKSWSPQPPNGTWSWDPAYLERLDNGEFKALKVGVTNVVYKANGVTHTIEVTILKAKLPVTGQQSLWIWILGVLGLCAAAGAGVLFLRKRQHGTSEE